MSARGGRRRKHRASTAKPSTMRVNRVRFGNFHTTNPIILGHICETWLAWRWRILSWLISTQSEEILTTKHDVLLFHYHLVDQLCASWKYEAASCPGQMPGKEDTQMLSQVKIVMCLWYHKSWRLLTELHGRNQQELQASSSDTITVNIQSTKQHWW